MQMVMFVIFIKKIKKNLSGVKNPLIFFAHDLILKPLYKELKNYDETDELLKLHGVEEELEENAEKLSRLEHFMSLGVLEPLIFSEEKYKLNAERKN